MVRSRWTRRLAALGAVLELLGLVACGSTADAPAGPTDAITGFNGTQRYAVDGVTGAGLDGSRLELEITDLGNSRATQASDVIVRVTSSDGVFVRAQVTVTSLSTNRIEGTLAAEDGTPYSVVLLLADDGTSVQVTLTRTSDQQTVEATAEVTTAGSTDTADPALLATATELYSDLLTAEAAEAEITTDQLRAARDAYAAALATAPDDPRANFGFGLFTLAAAASEGLDAIDALPERHHESGGGARQDEGPPPFDPDNYIYDEGVLNGNLDAAARLFSPHGTEYFLDAGLAVVVEQLFGPLTAKEPWWIIAHTGLDLYTPELDQLRQDEPPEEHVEYTADDLSVSLTRDLFLPALQVARRALERVTGVADFSYRVPFLVAESIPGQVVVSQSDAELLAGEVDLLTGMARLPLVYHWADADFELPTITVDELSDDLLTADEHLEPSPYGTLMADGLEQSRAALEALRRGVDHLASGWAVVIRDGTLFGDPIYPNALAPARHVGVAHPGSLTQAFDELHQMLAGEWVVDYAFLAQLLEVEFRQDVQALLGTADIPGFLTSPPADARLVVPTYERLTGPDEEGLSLFGCGFFDGERRGSWPPEQGLLTFGGLFTPGLTGSQAQHLFSLVLGVEPDEDDPDLFWYVPDVGSNEEPPPEEEPVARHR